MPDGCFRPGGRGARGAPTLSPPRSPGWTRGRVRAGGAPGCCWHPGGGRWGGLTPQRGDAAAAAALQAALLARGTVAVLQARQEARGGPVTGGRGGTEPRPRWQWGQTAGEGRTPLGEGGAALPAAGEPLARLLPHGLLSLSSRHPLGASRRGAAPRDGGNNQGRAGPGRGLSAPRGTGVFTLGGGSADVAAAGGAALASPGAVAVSVTELQAGSQGAPQHHGARARLHRRTAGPCW